MIDFIDYSKSYRVEAIPSKDVKELGEKGISTFPGTTQYVVASYNYTLNKYENTGFDETAPEILRLTGDKKKEVQSRIKEKREEIESLAGLPEGYLKATSDAWITPLCIGEIEVGQDLKVRVNNHPNVLKPAENYKDAITLTLLMNNPHFPKSKSDIGKPEYRNAKFYLTTDEEQSELTRGSLQKRKQAYLNLSELFDDKKNKQRSWEVAFKLGLVNKQKVDPETLEIKMHDSIFNDKTGKTLELFLEACALDNGTLAIHNMFQQAINVGVIRVSADGYYHRGHNNYRKTKQESIEYLMSAGMEVELGELRSEVEGRKKKHNAIG
jgi:hypothetical protein